jgi:small GTP-binding protein
VSLSVGIVGLPNVGKSTLFNVLLKRQLSPTAGYPFTTIKPHTGVVPVPDENLMKLGELLKPGKIVPATVTFVDIAGLVRGAHAGEGLGNEFLGYVRNCDILVHVVRAFESSEAPHIEGTVDPDRDRGIIREELAAAGIDKPILERVNHNMGDFENVDALIRDAYALLGLLTFYTVKGGKEISAWSVKNGATALDAAGRVHTDFAQKFIKAEVIPVDILLASGSWARAREAGKIRLEGKEYIVCDRDVVEFKVGT